MISPFFKYFFRYLFFGKTRQTTLLISFAGLLLSSLALLVLQSTMGGLQGAIKDRSKAILGSGTIYLRVDGDNGDEDSKLILQQVLKLTSKVVPEMTLEVGVAYHSKIMPLIVHGVSTEFYTPLFLQNASLTGIYLPIAASLRPKRGESLQIISPAHLDSMLGDIPRSITLPFLDYFITDVAEIDTFHAYTRLEAMQNLARRRTFNQLRIFDNRITSQLKSQFQNDKAYFKSWEEENSSLLFALNLETSVMVFLFTAMTLLVSFCIMTGLSLFLTKIRRDLTGFWLLGLSEWRIKKSLLFFMISLNMLAIFIGLALGTIALLLFQEYAGAILPAIFVDQKIPVVFAFKSYFLSMVIPLVISTLFTYVTFKDFFKHSHLMQLLKNLME